MNKIDNSSANLINGHSASSVVAWHYIHIKSDHCVQTNKQTNLKNCNCSSVSHWFSYVMSLFLSLNPPGSGQTRARATAALPSSHLAAWTNKHSYGLGSTAQEFYRQCLFRHACHGSVHAYLQCSQKVNNKRARIFPNLDKTDHFNYAIIIIIVDAN